MPGGVLVGDTVVISSNPSPSLGLASVKGDSGSSNNHSYNAC